MKPRTCRECGCTDNDCRQCIKKTGSACHWVANDLCSACVATKKPGPVYPIPPGTPARQCKGCPAQIYWIRTEAGRVMPVNADGISHFVTCPSAAGFRKKISKLHESQG